MATIRKRGARWQVQVRRKGNTAASRSFLRKADAELWARQMEAEADRNGLPVDPKQLQRLTVADLIRRYRDTVTVRKRGKEYETIRLNVLLRHSLAQASLATLTSSLFTSYREERLRICKPETVRRELSLLQHVFEVARKEWSVPLQTNPVADVRKPPAHKPRDRRLDDDEASVLEHRMAMRNQYKVASEGQL